MKHSVACIFFTALIAGQAAAHPTNEIRLQRLTAHIEADPSNPILLVSRAREYIHDENWLLAEQDLLKAKELTGPEFIEFEMGLLNLARGELEQAKLNFESQLFSNSPRLAQVHWQLGKINTQLGNTDSALEHFHSFLHASDAPHPGDIAKAVKTARDAGQNSLAREFVEFGIQRVGQVPQLLRIRNELD